MLLSAILLLQSVSWTARVEYSWVALDPAAELSQKLVFKEEGLYDAEKLHVSRKRTLLEHWLGSDRLPNPADPMPLKFNEIWSAKPSWKGGLDDAASRLLNYVTHPRKGWSFADNWMVNEAGVPKMRSEWVLDSEADASGKTIRWRGKIFADSNVLATISETTSAKTGLPIQVQVTAPSIAMPGGDGTFFRLEYRFSAQYAD